MATVEPFCAISRLGCRGVNKGRCLCLPSPLGRWRSKAILYLALLSAATLRTDMWCRFCLAHGSCCVSAVVPCLSQVSDDLICRLPCCCMHSCWHSASAISAPAGGGEHRNWSARTADAGGWLPRSGVVGRVVDSPSHEGTAVHFEKVYACQGFFADEDLPPLSIAPYLFALFADC